MTVPEAKSECLYDGGASRFASCSSCHLVIGLGKIRGLSQQASLNVKNYLLGKLSDCGAPA